MTFQALPEATVDRRIVRQAMAIPAGRGCRMWPLMAIEATDAAVPGCRRRQIVALLFVAGAAKTVGEMADRHDFQWLMSRMATQAVFRSLAVGVRLVAFQACGNFFVPTVTAVAEQFGMPAGCGCHPLPDFGMAGKAFLPGRLQRITQRFQRLMRVRMTMPAVLQPVMGQVVMTIIAPDRGFPP